MNPLFPFISFVVIGRNEGAGIVRALQSVRHACNADGVTHYELIYADSNSTDDSVAQASQFQGVRVCRIRGASGAAIARNEGARMAVGSVLFFLDGDMELLPGFLRQLFTPVGKMVHPFMSGLWENWYYDVKGHFLNKQVYQKVWIDRPTFQSVTGGFFVMEKAAWLCLDGMDDRLVAGQDLDLGLRSAQNGILLLRIPFLAVRHHTVAYRNEQRKWKSLFALRDLYARSVLYRKHFLQNRYVYRRMCTSDPGFLFLMVALCVAWLPGAWVGLLIHPALLAMAALWRNPAGSMRAFGSELAFLWLRDWMNALAFVLLWPKHPRYRVEFCSNQEMRHD